jgi:mRNA-degrading endonuclease RelE of RelBE toxin-antitoxin system
MYTVEYTQIAEDDLHYFNKSTRNWITDQINIHLVDEPQVITRKKKKLKPNLIADWELRVGEYRVFYDITTTGKMVIIKSVGKKEHNELFIRGKEVNL